MSCCFEQRYQDYRLALALNNMGVALLERGCYQQAMNTLKDAVHTMKVASRKRETSTGSTSDTDRKMQRAFKRFSMPHMMARPIHLDTISYEDSLDPLLGLSDGLSAGSCLRPTTIDLPPAVSSPSERDADLETAVMLCNFGLSYYLLSRTVEDASTSKKLLEHSHNVFDIASGVITSRFAVCKDEMDEARIMSVALLITGNLGQVHLETGHSSEAEELQKKYESIRMAMRGYDVEMWFGKKECRVTASAA